VTDAELVAKVLSGDAAATRAFVDHLVPVVQARAARALLRRGRATGRDARQEVGDLVQEVLVALFEDDARVLRAWDPARGLSMQNFVGLVAEREVASILRSGKRSPWKEEAAEMADLEASLDPVDAPDLGVASRELLDAVVDRVREELSPRGLELFFRLVVEEEPAESVCEAYGMTKDAVYAWRSRLGKLVRRFASELSRGPVSDRPAHPRTPPTDRAT
jgi:RNA polymerase sigma-70 factor (ECF subfamily)